MGDGMGEDEIVRQARILREHRMMQELERLPAIEAERDRWKARAEQAEAEHAILLTRYREIGDELGRLREIKAVHEGCAGQLSTAMGERANWERTAGHEKAWYAELLHTKYRGALADVDRLRLVQLEAAASTAASAPVPMLLTCPACRERHVDRGEFAMRSHHTHACQHCGMTWRPALVPTVGVQYLPGFKNEGE